MSDKEIRAQVDTENVKGLILINGGGAVALLAFLPSILGKPEYAVLARAILLGLLLFHLGLAAALIHNHLRRRCSLAYESNKPRTKFFWLGLAEPQVCHFSHIFMTISYCCFIIAGCLIFTGGMHSLGKSQSLESAQIKAISDGVMEHKKILGA